MGMFLIKLLLWYSMWRHYFVVVTGITVSCSLGRQCGPVLSLSFLDVYDATNNNSAYNIQWLFNQRIICQMTTYQMTTYQMTTCLITTCLMTTCHMTSGKNMQIENTLWWICSLVNNAIAYVEVPLAPTHTPAVSPLNILPSGTAHFLKSQITYRVDWKGIYISYSSFITLIEASSFNLSFLQQINSIYIL